MGIYGVSTVHWRWHTLPSVFFGVGHLKFELVKKSHFYKNVYIIKTLLIYNLKLELLRYCEEP